MSIANADLIELAADIVAAYVANNSVPVGDLGALISSTFAALSQLGGQPAAIPAEPLIPAVSIRKSVTPEAIICLEDGKSFKSLKRHLSSKYGMTPAEYRTKWGLPADYPMVAPAYAESRSALAKAMGLGRKAAAAAGKPKATQVRSKKAA